ncbi:MAG: hypothetical protein DRJ42_17485 [Deltaproteobacteria bacterium]|nr:MAG: hypothetical protein DRJ42_17485 [Deltaproteobacteria bacterium]
MAVHQASVAVVLSCLLSLVGACADGGSSVQLLAAGDKVAPGAFERVEDGVLLLLPDDGACSDDWLALREEGAPCVYLEPAGPEQRLAIAIIPTPDDAGFSGEGPVEGEVAGRSESLAFALLAVPFAVEQVAAFVIGSTMAVTLYVAYDELVDGSALFARARDVLDAGEVDDEFAPVLARVEDERRSVTEEMARVDEQARRFESGDCSELEASAPGLIETTFGNAAIPGRGIGVYARARVTACLSSEGRIVQDPLTSIRAYLGSGLDSANLLVTFRTADESRSPFEVSFEGADASGTRGYSTAIAYPGQPASFVVRRNREAVPYLLRFSATTTGATSQVDITPIHD